MICICRFLFVFSAIVINDRETGRSRGFGFVNYTTDESANKAVSGMDGQVCLSHQLTMSHLYYKLFIQVRDNL